MGHTVRDYSHTVVAHTLGRLATVAALPFTLRLFAPHEYARFSLFIVCVMIAGLAINWTANALWRFGTEEFVRHRTCRRTFWSVYAIRLPCALTAVVVTWFLREPVLQFTQLPPAALPAFLLIIAFGMPDGLIGLLQGQQRFRAAAWLLQTLPLLNVATIALMSLGVLPASPVLLAYSVAVGSILLNVLCLSALGRTITPTPPHGDTLREVWQFSWPFFFHGIGIHAIEYMDPVILRRYASLEAVGLYAVAYSMYGFMRAPIQQMAPLLLPRTIMARMRGETQQITLFYEKIAPQLVLAVSLLFGLALPTLPLIGLFLGARFSGSLLPLAILIGSLPFQVLTVLSTSMFYAGHKTPQHIVATQVAAGANLVLGLVLVPLGGVVGAAVAKHAAEFVNMLAHLLYFQRYFMHRLLGSAVWSAPLWLVLLTVCFGAPWWCSAGAWVGGALGACYVGRRRGLFNRESAAFFGKLGMPPLVAARVIHLYERWLIA